MARVLKYLFVFLLFLAQAGVVSAGFGITPPYFKNHRLTRGSLYQEKILLVRNNPVEDLRVEITKRVDGINDWFSIDKGEEFVFKKGEKQLPITISVHVPKDAEYRHYAGVIRIRTSPMEVPKGGGVSIALGAQVDVDLNVVEKILDFEVKKIRVLDLEEGYKKWTLFFPGKIRMFIQITNTGNAKYGPKKVKLEIFDYVTKELLETVYNTNKIRQIEPFATEEVLAEFPTRLKAGRYTAKYTIYKEGEEIAKQGEFNLSISALGTIPGYEGYGFWGLSLKDKLKVFGVLAAVIFIFTSITILALKRRKRKRRQKIERGNQIQIQ